MVSLNNGWNSTEFETPPPYKALLKSPVGWSCSTFFFQTYLVATKTITNMPFQTGSLENHHLFKKYLWNGIWVLNQKSWENPQLIPSFHRVLNYFHHPFWGVKSPYVWFNIHILLPKKGGFKVHLNHLSWDWNPTSSPLSLRIELLDGGKKTQRNEPFSNLDQWFNGYSPENERLEPKVMEVDGRCSFSKRWFSGSILVFGGVSSNENDKTHQI